MTDSEIQTAPQVALIKPTKEQRRASALAAILAKPDGQKTLRRHQQILNTREIGTIKLIEKTNRSLVKWLNGVPKHEQVFILGLNDEKNKELIRLRKSLVSSQVHMERFAASILPRLKSKANECRNLRTEIETLNETIKALKSKSRARARCVTQNNTRSKVSVKD